MGIFNFFKSSDKKRNKKTVNQEVNINNNVNNQQIRRPIYDIVNNESEMIESGNYSDDFKDISYYDEFGKEFKMPKKDWIEKKLYPAIKKNWSNMDGLYPIIQDAFSKGVYPEVKEAVLRFYATDENFERKLILLGTYHIKTGSCQNAVELYEKNLNINNLTEGLCIAYAEALELCGKSAEAEKKYYEAIEINPNSSIAFKKYFDIVKNRSNEEYENKLEKLSEISGNWRAKMKQAIVYFKKGNKESGNYYLTAALKESSYNSEIMSLTSSIYILNELYDEFKQYVLAYYNPEKHNAYTALNVLKYYKIKDMYRIYIFNEKFMKIIFNFGNDEYRYNEICRIATECITLSRADWDSHETSWDFSRHPLLVRPAATLAVAYEQYKAETNARFDQLRCNEEELNRIFIDIYGLTDELTPEIEDRDVTVSRIFDTKEEIPASMKGSNYAITKSDVMKSLISYAVGCMFGRYSLDTPGLAYAGGAWDDSKYTTFLPDEDAILPICDDEYFDDDIVGRFVEFIATVFGRENLEENLQFIADALGGRGSSREIIRSYFLTGFYADHIKTYQKRPIYWLFDSGKKNGFKCLVYMHRYCPDTIARIRTDYVHEQQSRYRTAIESLEQARDNAATAGDKVKVGKKLAAVEAQAKELREYEEKIHHLADQMIAIDLDDGVKHNYAIFQDVLAKIK